MSDIAGSDVVAIAKAAQSTVEASEKKTPAMLPKLSVSPVGSLASKEVTDTIEEIKHMGVVSGKASEFQVALLQDILMAINRLEEKQDMLQSRLEAHIETSEREWDNITRSIAAINIRPRSVEALAQSAEFAMESSGNDGDESEEEGSSQPFYEPSGSLTTEQLTQVAGESTEILDVKPDTFKHELFSRSIAPSEKLREVLEKKATMSSIKKGKQPVPGGIVEEIEWSD
jgi:hypothetical protein